MAAREQQARIDQVSWYHEFDFGGGLQARSRTPDIENHRSLWQFIEKNLEDVDFRGKTVLEIGSWDGYWSFYAERRGAKEVLASDDLTQNWASGEGILLARELLNSGIEIRQNPCLCIIAVAGTTRSGTAVLSRRRRPLAGERPQLARRIHRVTDVAGAGPFVSESRRSAAGRGHRYTECARGMAAVAGWNGDAVEEQQPPRRALHP